MAAAAPVEETASRSVALQFTLHSKAGAQTYELREGNAAPSRADVATTIDGGVTRVVYSRDGTLLAAVRSTDVAVRSAPGAPQLAFDVPRARVSRVAFSPLGTFLTTWEQQLSQQQQANLYVWRVAEAAALALCAAPLKPAACFSHKASPTGDARQPLLVWSPDEAFCARVVREGVDILNGSDPSAPALRRIPHAHVSQLAWCPSRHLLATFSAPRGSGSGCVSIWDARPDSTATAAMSTKNFFQADSCTLEWNPAVAASGGPAPLLLAHVSTDVDPTGKSYYGQSSLFVLHPTKPDMNAAIVFKKEGAIHSFAWHPQGKAFAVVYGFMPSMLTVFEVQHNGSYSQKADLGPFSRNVAIYSPDGNTLCVGGFGNLQGEMDFVESNTFARLGRAQAHTSTSWTWSPDGQRFACAVCAPRRRVDNGYKIFSVTGELLYQEAISELYDFVWRPDPKATANAMKNPRRVTPSPARSSSPSSSTVSGTSSSPSPPVSQGKYIPPGARGIPGANSSIVVHEESTDHVTVYSRDGQVERTTVNSGRGRGGAAASREEDLPPGWTPEKPKKTKKKKKQQATQQQQQQQS